MPSPRGSLDGSGSGGLSVEASWLARKPSISSTFSRSHSLDGLEDDSDISELDSDNSSSYSSRPGSRAGSPLVGPASSPSNGDGIDGPQQSMVLPPASHQEPAPIVPTEWLQMVFDRMDTDGSGDVRTFRLKIVTYCVHVLFSLISYSFFFSSFLLFFFSSFLLLFFSSSLLLFCLLTLRVHLFF